MKVAIVGGGITGLAAAHRLLEIAPAVETELYESGPRLGGVLQTETIDHYLVERSADMFTTKDPAALNLCRRIGFDTELIGTQKEFQRAFIAQGRQLVPVPKGLNLMSPSDLDAIRSTSLLSDAGKKRFLEETRIPRREGNGDESLYGFAVRRFGTEAYERIFQPLIGGIYTADPKKLSLRATLPQYLEMENEHGSVIQAIQGRESSHQAPSENRTSGARYNLFVAPKGGIQTLVDAIVERLKQTRVFLNSPVQLLEKSNAGWTVTANGDPRHYDAVLVAAPANVGARLVANHHPQLGEMLGSIEYASSAIVIHGWKREQIEHPLDGFGFVVPLVENRKILAGSFSSVKFPGRAPVDRVLTRSFVGGVCQSHLLDADDAEICQQVRGDLSELLGLKGSPELEKVVRWTQSMPQYNLGHVELRENIKAEVRKSPGLAIAGKSYSGVGVPACIESGERAAEELYEELGGAQ